MPQPVFTLSVDLNAKTANFQSGMSEAAKAARGSFDEIKDGAREMGASTGGSMTEARHGVALLGEEFGIRLPRALTTFLASIGPVGAAMEAAFPFLAILAGVTLLIEHLKKLQKAAEENAAGWQKIGDESEAALQKTEREIKQVDNATSELTGGPLLALKHQLENIDQQQFDSLLGNFKKVSDEIDRMLGGEQRGNIMSMLFGQNVEGDLKDGFDKFKNAYSSFLQTGDTKLAAEALEREIGAVGTKLEELRIASQNTTAPGLKEDLANVHSLYNELVNVAAFQEKQQELAAKQKNLQSQSAEAKDPQAFHPELFVEAENQKRVSLKETLALIKKEQEESDKATELQLLGVESLEKGLKELAAERAKLAAEAGKEDGRHGAQIGELQLAADREAGQMRIAQGHMTEAEIISMELEFAAREHAIKQEALKADIAALNQNDKETINHKQVLTNKLLELDKQYANQAQQIQDQAHKKQIADLQTTENRIKSAYAAGFTDVIMGKQSFGQVMQKIDSQIAQNAIQNAIESLMMKKGIDGQTRFEDARTAAADAYKWAGNPILGAVAAGATFAAVMAFQEGGIVPGVGRGDSVPALLEPGEGVLTKKVMDGLTNQAKFGSTNSGPDVHIHHHQTNHIHAIDADGVHQMLQEHGEQFTKHATNTLRKMNR